MKRSSFILLLILIFTVNNFSQAKTPAEFVNEFWNLAVKNDFEGAKKQINSSFFGKEKLEGLKQIFQTVSKNEMSITKFEKEEALQISAEYVFRIKGKSEQEILVRIRLIKTLDVWQVMSLETFVEVLVEADDVFVQPLPIPDSEQKKPEVKILPLEPYNEKKNPAKIIAEPYKSNKNPAKYQYVIPKPE